MRGALAGTPLQPLFGEARRRRVLWLLGAGVVVVGAVQFPLVQTMQERGAGVIEFELARTSAEASEILAGWGEEGRSAARTSTWLDYPFLVFLFLFLCGACVAVAERARRAGLSGWARAGVVVAWGALAALVLDAVEDVGLLVMLGGEVSQPWPGLAFACASVKLALNAAAVAYIVLGLLASMVAMRQ